MMPCPLNGGRCVSEFAYGGEVRAVPAADDSDAVWSEYLFFGDNAAGVVREWWCHVPSAYWFVAERDTVSDEIVRAYAPEAMFEREGGGEE